MGGGGAWALGTDYHPSPSSSSTVLTREGGRGAQMEWGAAQPGYSLGGAIYWSLCLAVGSLLLIRFSAHSHSLFLIRTSFLPSLSSSLHLSLLLLLLLLSQSTHIDLLVLFCLFLSIFRVFFRSLKRYIFSDLVGFVAL